MKLSLAPNPWYWPREATFAFYRAMATQPLDIVYLGETVCSRRHELRAEDWLDLADELADAGKEVVLSTQALIESESDLKALRRLIAKVAEGGRHMVEANEMGAVRLLAEAGQRFVAGPTLNVFNAHTLRLLVDQGATRWVMPPEAGRAQLRGLLAALPADVQRPRTEVMAHGRLPLAWSARCFTARRYNLQKDTCEFKCIEHPQGLAVKTREGESFLTLNGVQTLSSADYLLLAEMPDLAACGVNVARLTPQHQGMDEVIAAFRAALDGMPAPAPGAEWCNGFWHGRPGMEKVAA